VIALASDRPWLRSPGAESVGVDREAKVAITRAIRSTFTLSETARRVLLAVLGLVGREGWRGADGGLVLPFSATRATVAKRTGGKAQRAVSTATVGRGLAELAGLGLIVRDAGKSRRVVGALVVPALILEAVSDASVIVVCAPSDRRLRAVCAPSATDPIRNAHAREQELEQEQQQTEPAAADGMMEPDGELLTLIRSAGIDAPEPARELALILQGRGETADDLRDRIADAKRRARTNPVGFLVQSIRRAYAAPKRPERLASERRVAEARAAAVAAQRAQDAASEALAREAQAEADLALVRSADPALVDRLRSEVVADLQGSDPAHADLLTRWAPTHPAWAGLLADAIRNSDCAEAVA